MSDIIDEFEEAEGRQVAKSRRQCSGTRRIARPAERTRLSASARRANNVARINEFYSQGNTPSLPKLKFLEKSDA